MHKGKKGLEGQGTEGRSEQLQLNLPTKRVVRKVRDRQQSPHVTVRALKIMARGLDLIPRSMLFQRIPLLKVPVVSPSSGEDLNFGDVGISCEPAPFFSLNSSPMLGRSPP